jgi:2-oxoglutarate ferredoxin oxidoreductase subunit delta
MKYKYVIEVDRCKGCGLCIDVCPKKVLAISNEVNTKGYFAAYQIRPQDCVYCSTCCIMCPDAAISITGAADQGKTGVRE